jgi:signal transduction histidine kinase
VLNVVMNAFQAMPDGGDLTLETEERDGRFVLLVTDTGQGVSKDNLAKIFEPFFTTKREGLGLGLATTKRIVEEHGGTIELSSGEQGGSTVMISLPLTR